MDAKEKEKSPILSIRAMNYVWENSAESEGSLLLLLAIADHAHDDGSGAFPSIESLARKSRLSCRHVQRILRQLEECGEIITHRNAGPNGVNIYCIPMGRHNVRGVTPMSPGGRHLRQKGVTPMSPKPSYNHHITIYSNEFEEFWKAYPRKVAKATALRAWKRVDAPLQTILDSLKRFRGSADWKKDNGQFIPYPATWLNARRWEDEPIKQNPIRSCL